MKYNDLKITTHRPVHRVGRGIAAGQGKTAGRGTKGQNSRTGSSRHPGFEGGSNPLLQRLPKLPGFTSHKLKKTEVTTGQLANLGVKVIDNYVLAKAGVISTENSSVKLIINGEITKPLTVKLQAASMSAVQAIEKVGGTFTKVDQIGREKLSKKE